MRRQAPPMLPGWGPLADSGPRRSIGGGRIAALVWPSLALAAFAALVAYLLAADPAAGLSLRSLTAVALAVIVLAVLTVRRRGGVLAVLRSMAEYATVALLAVLLVTAAGPPPFDVDQDRPARMSRAAPAEQARGGQDQDQAASLPPVIRHAVGAWSWLAGLWEQADRQASRRESNPTPTTRAERPRAAPLPDRTGGNLA
jgi:hypothetical protein